MEKVSQLLSFSGAVLHSTNKKICICLHHPMSTPKDLLTLLWCFPTKIWKVRKGEKNMSPVYLFLWICIFCKGQQQFKIIALSSHLNCLVRYLITLSATFNIWCLKFEYVYFSKSPYIQNFLHLFVLAAKLDIGMPVACAQHFRSRRILPPTE